MNIQRTIEAAQVARRILPTSDWTITRPLNDWIDNDEGEAEFLFIIADGFARLTGMSRQEYINEPAEFFTRTETIDWIGSTAVEALENQASTEWSAS